jgi:glucosamine--fructose-6-phosphate aminotransferase (isomerizing)
MSAMRETMNGQPEALRRVLADTDPLGAAVERLHGREVFLVGTGTSWHAANQGASLLRLAGVRAWPVQAQDAALAGPFPKPEDALVLMTHRGTKRYTSDVLQRARAEGVPTVVISRVGNPEADLDTVPNETSSAFTASHLGALLRVGQLAVALGATLDLGAVPDVVAAELAAGATGVIPPRRLLEFAGVGANAWTAGEGALKTRETSYVATEGGNCEHILHGPSVALGSDDALVCLNGGGPGAERLDDLALVASSAGSTVHRFDRTDLGEPLSIFALTVVVQKIAAECAEALGTNPDSFGKDLPGRAAAWDRIQL